MADGPTQCLSANTFKCHGMLRCLEYISIHFSQMPEFTFEVEELLCVVLGSMCLCPSLLRWHGSRAMEQVA